MSHPLLAAALARLPDYATVPCLEPARAYSVSQHNGLTFAASGPFHYPPDIVGDGVDNLIIFGESAESRKMGEIRVHGRGNIVYFGPRTRVSYGAITIRGDNNFIYVGSFTSANDLYIARRTSGSVTVIGDRSMLSNNIQFGRPEAVGLFEADGSGRFDRDQDIVCGDYCWIGRNVVIEPGTRLGSHCVVAQAATLSGTFPDHSVVAGFPGRVRRSGVIWARTVEETYAETLRSSHAVQLFDRPLDRLKKRIAEMLAAPTPPDGEPPPTGL